MGEPGRGMGQGGQEAPRGTARARVIDAARTAPWLGGLARPWPDPRHLPGILAQGLSGALALEFEERRGFLWLPVGVGLGIALYFAADTEPSLPVAVGLAMLLAVLAWAARARAVAFHLFAGLAAVAAGFALATAHTARIAHPVLAQTLVAAELTGFVERAEQRGEGSRIVLRLTTLKPSGRARSPEAMPERARVSLRGAAPDVGAHVGLRATIGPPPGPAYPGGFDFGRDAWFEGIGATGYALGGTRASPAPEPASRGLEAAAWLERLRLDIAARIGVVLTGDVDAIASALVTGLRGGISEQTEETMRVSGLSHILSISGLHMALVASTAFLLARALLAFSPALALRHPIKAWAAVPAILAASFYLVLSGNEVPTQRSYVMAMLVLVGVMLGRPALTLRTLALAALIVLACAPATLLDPGTQMSFAATLALVAAHERFGRRLLAGAGGRDWTGMALRAVLAVAFTSLIAGLATAPFAAFHFQRAAPYGLLANLGAIPLVSFIVMPAGLLGALLLPLGLDGPAWRMMGWGIEGMMAVAAWVAALPGADRGIPAFPLAALALAALAIVTACLLRSRLVIAAPLLAAAALLVAWDAKHPVLLADAAGRTVAVRGPDGRLALMGDRPPDILAGRFAAEQWRIADGEAPSVAHARNTEAESKAAPVATSTDTSPTDAARTMPARTCDRLGCVLPLPDGRLAALSLSRDSLADDCRLATVLVTPHEPPKDCAAQVVRTDPRGTGASVALYEEVVADGRPATLRLVSARPAGITRPWLPAPPDLKASAVTSTPRPADPAGAADTQALPPDGRRGDASPSVPQ